MGFHVFNSTIPLPDNKPRRGYYTRSILCNAVKQVIRGAMTVTQAAHHYRIPRATIQKHFRAREQHNLKDLYIRRMKGLESDLNQMPEGVFQQQFSDYGTASPLSCEVNIWPNDHNEASTSLRCREQPVRITYSPRYINHDKEEFPCESNMAMAEHRKIMLGDVEPVVPLHGEQEASEGNSALFNSCSSSLVN